MEHTKVYTNLFCIFVSCRDGGRRGDPKNLVK